MTLATMILADWIRLAVSAQMMITITAGAIYVYLYRKNPPNHLPLTAPELVCGEASLILLGLFCVMTLNEHAGDPLTWRAYYFMVTTALSDYSLISAVLRVTKINNGRYI